MHLAFFIARLEAISKMTQYDCIYNIPLLINIIVFYFFNTITINFIINFN